MVQTSILMVSTLSLVGQTSRSAADVPVRLLGVSTAFEGRVQEDPRRPGGPPHKRFHHPAARLAPPGRNEFHCDVIAEPSGHEMETHRSQEKIHQHGR